MLALPKVPTPWYSSDPDILIPAIVPDVAAPTALISALDVWFAVAPDAAPLVTVLAAVPPIVTPSAIEPEVALIAPAILKFPDESTVSLSLSENCPLLSM